MLKLYPSSFRSEFEEQMILDFSDMAMEASKKGRIFLAKFFFQELIDFPVNLLQMCFKEGRMFKKTYVASDGGPVTPVFHSGPVRSAFQGAFALAVALIVMWSIVDWILIFLHDQGWMFLLRIANSRGWTLNYSNTSWTIIYFIVLLLGALLAGAVLALCLRQTRRMARYWLAGFLGLVTPLVLIRIFGLVLKINNETFRNRVIDVSWIILAGLGFGVMFNMILQDRKKIPWLLFAGVFGYYAANNIALWLLTPLFPTYTPGPFTWNDLAYVIGVYGITGIILGGILGAVSGWSAHKSALA